MSHNFVERAIHAVEDTEPEVIRDVKEVMKNVESVNQKVDTANNTLSEIKKTLRGGLIVLVLIALVALGVYIYRGRRKDTAT